MNKKKILSMICFILALLFITVGILMLPNVTNFGTTILLYVLAGVVLGYVCFYLVNKVKKYQGIRQILVVIEMVLDFVIILSLVFNEFVTFLSIKEGFKVIGIVVWIHAAFSIMDGYFANSDDKYQFAFSKLLFEIFLLTISTLIFINPWFNNNELLMVTIVLSFAVAMVLICIGIINLKSNKKPNELGLK